MFILGVTFKEFIQKGNVIFGIVCAIIGIAVWILSTNIAKVVRKNDVVQPNDSVLVGCRVVGLVMILVGMVLIAIPL